MSSVKIKGSPTGTAAFTIAVPDGTSTDRTINLPDAAGSFVLADGSNNVAVTGDLTVDTNTLHVDAANNRVGVGTASPSRNLQIGDNTDSAAIVSLQTTTSGKGSIYFGDNTATSAEYAGVIRYDHADNSMQFWTDSTERARIDSGGNFKVSNGTIYLDDNGSHNGVINAPASLFINIDSDSTAVGEDFVIGTNRTGTSGGTELLRVDDEGRFFCPSIYTSTTGSGANVNVASTGRLERSTSSLRYKNTINDATHGLTELLTLRPVTYKGNNDGDTVFGGLIAEEVHDAGLTEFVQYDEQDRPDALSYGNMVSLCIKAIQELNAKVEACEAKNTEQQALIEDLQTRLAALEAV